MPRRAWRYRTVWLLPSFLVGCTSDRGEVRDPGASGEVVERLMTLSASSDSLGPIAGTTPFDRATLQELFPTATVADVQRSSEGEPYAALRIAVGPEPILEVRSRDGAHIHTVEILTGPGTSRLGALHGTRFDAVYGADMEAGCSAGMEEESGTALCVAPFSPKVMLVFAGSFDGPDGFLPPSEVLASWIVRRVIWRP